MDDLDIIQIREDERKHFIEEVFEIAFGDGASLALDEDEIGEKRKFTYDEVLDRLREFSDVALKWDEAEEDLIALCEDNEVMVETIKEYFNE